MGANWKFFRSSIWVTVSFLAIAGFVGWYFSKTLQGALTAVFFTFILSILEVSISFDNAVVNAAVLKKMTPLWQRRFLTWGIAIAVFGMRLVFPLLIVSIAVDANPWAALKLAVLQPEEYAKAMMSVHHEVSAFGGAFLMMVALKYFFDSEKVHHWIHSIEEPLAKMGKLEAVEVGLCLLVIIIISRYVPQTEALSFLYSGVAGVITYLAVQAISTLLESSQEKHTEGGLAIDLHRASMGAFIYLEVLDASFSFDGVIGAFAISNNIFIIALGLGVGAMFVRSLTIMMVEKETLKAFAFLEHGAFYAVFSLSVIMFLNAITHVNEVVTAVISITFILLSIWSSYQDNKKRRH